MGLSQEESLGEGGKKMDKCCSDCKTTKTPLWRGGPAGPKSLCNACGIRFRKRRRSELGLNKGGTGKKKERTSDSTNITGSTVATAVGDHSEEEGGLSESVKMGLMAFSKEVLMQQRSSSSSPPPPFWFASPVKRQRSKRKLREEEQAAVLLMSLSCGSVFA